MNKKGFAVSIILYSMVFLIVTILYMLLGIEKNRYTVNERMRKSVFEQINEYEEEDNSCEWEVTTSSVSSCSATSDDIKNAMLANPKKGDSYIECVTTTNNNSTYYTDYRASYIINCSDGHGIGGILGFFQLKCTKRDSNDINCIEWITAEEQAQAACDNWNSTPGNAIYECEQNGYGEIESKKCNVTPVVSTSTIKKTYTCK